MNVSFTPQARDDLVAIRDWIARDDERAADRVVSRIIQTAMMFGAFPIWGASGNWREHGSSPSSGCRI